MWQTQYPGPDGKPVDGPVMRSAGLSLSSAKLECVKLLMDARVELPRLSEMIVSPSPSPDGWYYITHKADGWGYARMRPI